MEVSMAKANKGRRAFDKVFKQNAVRMVVDEGLSQAEVALKLDVGRTALTRWVKNYKQFADNAFPGEGNHREGSSKELARLRRELKETQDERDILKKALVIFSRPKRDDSPL
jgi:transposase